MNWSQILVILKFNFLLGLQLVQCRGGNLINTLNRRRGGGGGGGLPDAAFYAIVIFGCVLLVISLYYIFCRCGDDKEEARRSVRRQRSINEWRAVEFRANATRNERAPRIGATMNTYNSTASTTHTNAPNAVFSTHSLRKVQIPHNISEDEEFAIYAQDQEWLAEIKEESPGCTPAWMVRKRREFENNIDGKKNLQRFSAVYAHTFGLDSRCNGCRRKLQARGEWYRCRVCVDIDFCTFCFERGPSIAEYGHVPSHEATKLQMILTCAACKGLIYNTTFVCQQCSDVYFCLGCVKTMKHQLRHEGHGLDTFQATSYLMVKEHDIIRDTSPSAPPGGRTMTSLYPDAPPAYAECV